MVQDQPELSRISFSPLASTGILNCKSWSGAESAHIDMLNLELINTSVSPQRQPAENQKNIRSLTLPVNLIPNDVYGIVVLHLREALRVRGGLSIGVCLPLCQMEPPLQVTIPKVW